MNDGEKQEDYIHFLRDKFDELYENEQSDEEELKNLIDLIKLDDNNDFYKMFTNLITNLIKSNEEENFFDFKSQANINILDFIYNYTYKLRYSLKKDKKREKEKKKETNISNNNINTLSESQKQSENNQQNKNDMSNKDKSTDENISQIGSCFFTIHEKFICESGKKEVNDINNEESFATKIKKIDFKCYDKIEEKHLQSHEKSFENDTITYIFNRLYKVSSSKSYSIIFDYCPPLDKINDIFSKYKLFELNKIQFDFVVINLKLSDLIGFLIDIYPGIHMNSKLSFVFNEKRFFTLNDLMNIRNNSDENIDIIGEIGINILNDEDKCYQLVKYAKLIHNINELIKKQATELPFLLDLLKLNGNNKKLLLFITDGTYSNYKNIKKNNFLTCQTKLQVDSLLVFRNKNFLFRTKLLEKIFKKYKKEEAKLFNDEINEQFEIIMKESFLSENYEKVVKKLTNFEKKIKHMKNDLFDYSIKNEKFIILCNLVMKTISKREIKNISKDNFEKAKRKFVKLVAPIEKVETKYYIIYDDYYEKNQQRKSLIETLRNKKIQYIEGKDMDILGKNSKKIYKIIIFFIAEPSIFLGYNCPIMINLQNEYHINKFHKIYFYIDDENDKIKLEPFKLILNLNFDYICDKNHYDKIIEKIEKDEYKDELYKKYIIYLNEEKIYKVIIDQYINLFDKSIYGKKKESSKNEQLLNKINQDIQFFQNFEINNNITLNTETKTAINNLFNEEIIKKIINEFIDQKNILNEIEDILLNFENEIQEKIKANKNQLDSNVINNKDKNEGNNKNKEKNKKKILVNVIMKIMRKISKK